MDTFVDTFMETVLGSFMAAALFFQYLLRWQYCPVPRDPLTLPPSTDLGQDF